MRNMVDGAHGRVGGKRNGEQKKREKKQHGEEAEVSEMYLIFRIEYLQLPLQFHSLRLIHWQIQFRFTAHLNGFAVYLFLYIFEGTHTHTQSTKKENK